MSKDKEGRQEEAMKPELTEELKLLIERYRTDAVFYYFVNGCLYVHRREGSLPTMRLAMTSFLKQYPAKDFEDALKTAAYIIEIRKYDELFNRP